ncbi:hypothetical protein MIND_00793500 [Mycena indigotica]|uniref:Uncharacterized protein n=1 Tax=Mycena indigotica TaxID=2126181 RepID=A0A8H6W1P3_9AGAR|nr:uncharacterized protein MIND_00793500 [Mycena indigotica]KAF7302264.1 hypothetical protein MIND_00793500 [Mycena indigotica]
MSRQLSAIDVPRPIALLCTLFRLQPPRTGFLARNFNDPLFQALRVWTDIGDICENESFDGHRKTIVEHTLNILILPGIHREGRFRGQPSTDTLLTNASTPPSPLPTSQHPSQASTHSFAHPTSDRPGPFYTRDSAGHITHHRDFWDVKDVLGLVPGVSLAQWIGTRLAAKGVAYATSLWGLGGEREREQEQERMEKGMMTSPIPVPVQTQTRTRASSRA